MTIQGNYLGYGTPNDVRLLKLVDQEVDQEMGNSSDSQDDPNFEQQVVDYDTKVAFESEQMDLLNPNAFEKTSNMTLEELKILENESWKKKREKVNMAVFHDVSAVQIPPEEYVEMRFSSSSHDVLPSSAAKLNLNRCFDIVGVMPHIDHPTFVDRRKIKTVLTVIHKHFENNEESRDTFSIYS
eukprot:CAMPEP_0117433398 /NCGR_PEP_ID=MMETSP0758-20121206/12773_1 /TAXON_ID=63605 /ORGANISM="Percolomonas cosmopolitus, Strain AE-1 (ATCC 50343)" /LENGTH=183 /DNA_ID=CAMNT_0005224049 /DNA_START=363 /DNA_END=914 /DNA_ORIENTATION=+